MSGGLTALWLAEAERPFLLLEAGDHLGGAHTWSFHGTDVSPEAMARLTPLVTARWSGHDVAFPSHRRTLEGEYLSIRSPDFDRVLRARLGDRVRLGAEVVGVDERGVRLASGETLPGTVLDARGFGKPSGACGWQTFLGLELELEAPHGLERPMVMDASVTQHGAFRFVYCLPWSARTVLVEDTYYADSPVLDRAVVRERVHDYARARGWKVARVLGEERGALPIPLEGETPRPSLPTIGVAAGLFHATTGFSVPMAVAAAELVAKTPEGALGVVLAGHAQAHWRQQGFFRLLNRMLFLGAAPEERVRIFDAFYRHPEALVARFYRGGLTALDVLRVLATGARTVPGPRAMRAALGLG